MVLTKTRLLKHDFPVHGCAEIIPGVFWPKFGRTKNHITPLGINLCNCPGANCRNEFAEKVFWLGVL